MVLSCLTGMSKCQLWCTVWSPCARDRDLWGRMEATAVRSASEAELHDSVRQTLAQRNGARGPRRGTHRQSSRQGRFALSGPPHEEAHRTQVPFRARLDQAREDPDQACDTTAPGASSAFSRSGPTRATAKPLTSIAL